MKDTLTPYLRHKPLLEMIVSNDLFLSEYAFLKRAKKDIALRKSLSEIFEIYKSARQKDKTSFHKLLASS